MTSPFIPIDIYPVCTVSRILSNHAYLACALCTCSCRTCHEVTSNTWQLELVKKDALKKMSGNKSVLAQQYQAQMSITKQMGLRDKPEDLISSIYMDHEQSYKASGINGAAVSRSALCCDQTAVKTPTGGQGVHQRYPAPTQSLPVSTTLPHPATSMHGESFSENARVRSVSAPCSVVEFQRSHFKPLSQAAKCANPNCRKAFARRNRRRNCNMCGDVRVLQVLHKLP